MDRTCANCGGTAPDNQQMYTIRIELFARAEPLVFTPEDLAADHASKLEELIAQMEAADPEEAADQVHEQYAFSLCAPCRARIHRGLKIKSKLTG